VRKAGLSVETQKPIQVLYDGEIVGEYYSDMLVEEIVVVELTLVRNIDEIHLAQCLNYLKATGMKTCLLINFSKTRVEVIRIIL